MNTDTGECREFANEEEMKKAYGHWIPIKRMPDLSCPVCGGGGSVIKKGDFKFTPCECTLKEKD